LFDQKWATPISEQNERRILFASAGTLFGAAHQPEPLSTPANNVQWSVLAESDERFIQHLGLPRARSLILLHASATSCALDTVSFRAWVETFVHHRDNWAALLAWQNRGAAITTANPTPLAMGTESCMV